MEELGLWREIIERCISHTSKRQVYPMDDGFMMRKPWDENKIPPEKRAWLYENYHPLFIMRHRMSKQADAILGMYLHNDLFTEEEIRRNYDFYQEVTCIILLCPPVFSESWHVTSAIWMKHINISHSLQEWISMITTTTSTRESMPPTWQEPGRRSLMDSQVCVVRMVC